MRATILVAALAMGLLTESLLHAADTSNRAASRERELGRRVQLLQRENRELGEKVKTLEEEAKEAKASLELARKEAASLSGRVASVSSEATDLRAEIAAKNERLNREAMQVKQLRQQLKEMSVRVAQGENDKRELQSRLDKQRQSIGRQGQMILACRSENDKLESLTADLLQRLKNERQSRADAVLGLGAVDSYNDYEAFRARHDAIRRGEPAARN